MFGTGFGKAPHLGTVVIVKHPPSHPGLSGSPALRTVLTVSGQHSVRAGGLLQTSCVEVKDPFTWSSCPGLGTSWEGQAVEAQKYLFFFFF